MNGHREWLSGMMRSMIFSGDCEKIMTTKILLSTDIGSDVDDALSLLVMLNHPQIDLNGIYTVNGKVDERCYIAKHMVNLSGQQIPVGRGSGQPLGPAVPPYYYYEDYLVDDSFLDHQKIEEQGDYEILFKPLESVGISAGGLQHLAGQLAVEKHVVFSIGPLTNLALLLRDYPKSAANIEQLYVMGAKFPEGVMEHNFRHDVVAAQEVLRSEIPITIVPGDFCGGYHMPLSIEQQMNGNELAGYVRSMLRGFVGSKFALAYHRERMGDDDLRRVLMKSSMVTARGAPQDELLQLHHFKKVFQQNINAESAYFEADDFLDDLDKLTEQLRNPKYGYSLGDRIADALDSLVPKEISIADVYIPYCFLHPENLSTERMTLDCDETGCTIVKDRGDGKHEVVMDLSDWKHFEEFVQDYIR